MPEPKREPRAGHRRHPYRRRCPAQPALTPGGRSVGTSWREAISGPVFRILVVEATAGIPQRLLVAVRGDPTRVLDQPGEMQQVPRQERRVSVCEVVFGAARSGVEVARAGTCFTQPGGVCLRWDNVAKM